MAFWGALVRTDEPLNVVLDGGPHRRLRVSQAALGRSRDRNTECNKSRNRLYCKVGENPRVLLCALRFNGTEMCSLDHQFTATDNVVFSVVGVRDIHISGYYFDEFPLRYTIMPKNQIASLSNREEVETSGDTFVLECPQGDGPQIGGQDAHMQYVGETGIDAPRPAEESALHDGVEQHINLVEQNRSPSINDCLEIVTQASEQSLMNIRALGSTQPILASGWKEMQNLPELLMDICYCLLAKAPYKMDWTNIGLSFRSRGVQEMLHVSYPMTGCFKHGLKSTGFGEKCNSDDKVNRYANLVQGNSGSRHMEKITLYELEPPGNIIEENESERKSGTREGELTKPDETLNNVDHLRGNSERLVDKQNIKAKRKKRTSKGLCACEDDFNAVHLESVHPEKAKDRDDCQLVDEDRLKPERKKRKTDRISMSVHLTSIRKEASEPNQQSGTVEPRKVVDCSKERSYIKKDKAAKWIFKRRGVDEENLQIQTDECETTMVNYHSGEQQQLKAKKKRKPETICDQDLRNQMSQSDDRDSARHITNEQEKDKLRSGLGTDGEKLETCDAPDAGEIKKRKKKKNRTEQVMVPAADSKQEHGRCVSVEPAATQLTSTGIENSWTIVAALPAFGNPQIKSTVVICKGILEVPPTVSCSSDAHDKGKSKKKGKEKLKTQQISIAETNDESSKSHSVESVETSLTSASVGSMMQKIIPALLMQKESNKKGKEKLKTQQMEVPIVETNNESRRCHSVESLLTSASVGNIIQKIIPALIHGHSTLKHGIVGSEQTRAVPSASLCQSDTCDLGEVEKKKKKKIENGEGSCVNESVRRRLFCAQDDNNSNQRIPSALSTDGHPKLKHDFDDPEETFELLSDLHDSGDIKEKKKMKRKKED